MNETGRQLASFAESLKLPFTFKMVIVYDMNDLHEDLFEIEADEVVGVYASLILRTMIIKPNRLENLLRVIRRLKPCTMTVTEVEGDQHNSSSFINSFIKSLFFYSAWFDCLNDCMDRNDPNRMSLEGKFLSRGIRSIVATEGDERMIMHVGINLWRSFGRFGFVEIQARLAAKKFACGGPVNLDMNEKSLIVGWKGTPLFSFSAWKLR
ncbi:DELLA protein 2-like [Magnolia sinica]|uniref:DELLA protein 2-like n=1 Tax=Magnolia sinica TaxID=86752 RepID=UPI00265B443E|nr:DELLA protein 2-like [Magnolia sinica]